MSRPPSFLEDPDDTREAIMRATYVALCEHGYSDLTIQGIGDEFSKSKSLLYHHYDSKDELLLDFLEFMLAQVEEQMPTYQAGGVDGYIDDIVDQTFAFGCDAETDDFVRAILELRSQAAHDEDFRAYFTRSDQFVRKHVAHTIRSGIEQGVFRTVSPTETAALFQIVFVGTITQRATTDDDVLTDARAEFERYVRECLLADD
ncbi:TetR/AcrR family transcriptional regulator [Halovivax limisalsi]|uniref:TetR/AcrR family transcriptional regulator n=1 Tax=Halovivax limisalsi TaxID=1453760 RepID=UPI001FFD9874|nr:TetR/AcrR family transcriptional regulator [Halovivax limisalsi]